METYKTAWWGLTAVATVIAVWTSLNTWPPIAWACTIVVGAAIGGCLAGCRTPGRLRETVSTGLVSGLILLASLQIVLQLGERGLLILVIAASCSPPVLRRLRRWSGRHETPNPSRRHSEPGTSGSPMKPWPDQATSTSNEVNAAGGLLEESSWIARSSESMDDASLCLTWRTSYLVLQRSVSIALRARVVQRRQELLDEMERRNARGFAAWLASGARAAGDPSRYILPARSSKDPDRRP